MFYKEEAALGCPRMNGTEEVKELWPPYEFNLTQPTSRSKHEMAGTGVVREVLFDLGN